MPVDQQLQVTGGVTQALLAALDQVHSAITARMVGPDGKPSGTAVYMHLPVGHPIDPSMYSYPWTPAGGSSAPARARTAGSPPLPLPLRPRPRAPLPRLLWRRRLLNRMPSSSTRSSRRSTPHSVSTTC